MCVICVSCLSCFPFCSLQPCGHLLERANLLGLLYVVFTNVFVTVLCGILGQVWYLIVSIPDLSNEQLYLHLSKPCPIVNTYGANHTAQMKISQT